MMRLRTLLLPLLLTVSSAAFGASAEEAATIKASLEKYLGSEPGVVTVTPEGEAYSIKLDAMPYVTKLAQDAAFQAQIDPITMNVAPLGGGKWKVTGTGPFGMHFTAPQSLSLSMQVNQQSIAGTFDEALLGFSESTVSQTGISVVETIKDPSTNADVNVNYTMDSMTAVSSSQAAAAGVDRTTTFTFSGVNMKASTPSADGQPNPALAAMNYTMSSGKGTSTVVSKGVRVREILDLVSWIVAHPGRDALKANQQELWQKLTAALPLFDSIDGDGGYEGVQIQTALGAFGLGKISGALGVNGILADGRFREAFTIEGITIPQGLLPPWAQDVVPQKFVLDFTLSGFNLDAPARMFLQEADLNKPDPVAPERVPLYQQAVLPSNALKLTLTANELSGPGYAITYDADFNITVDGAPPTGKVNMKVLGFDKIMAKVQEAQANDPSAQQTVAGLLAVKGMGKAEADGSLTYAIDIQPMAQIFVNGVNVSAMMAPQPPAQ